MDADLSPAHFEKVARYLAEGEVVPVLGAGINVCDRAAAEGYVLDQNLPSGRELSELLASEYEYPAGRDDRGNLLRVAQFAQARLQHSDEEHRLREKRSRAGISADAEHARLRDIETELDQAWDLLRQRRAKREFGQDPDEADIRPPRIVENYEN